MIRLTLLNGEHWYVNPDHIVGIKSGHKYGAAIESDHQTGISHTIDVTHVTESPEEVARKVLEWRLAMERYRVALSLEKRIEELELEINDWRAEVQKWQKFYKESEESHSETKELLHSTISEIKRYKQALEEIARGRFSGASYKARQALEESEEE